MKKAFRWACVVLSVVALCAWAPLLLRETRGSWKMIGVNETSDAAAETTKSGERQNEKKIAVETKADVVSPGDGDQMLDLIVVQQERQQDSSEIQAEGHMF